MEPYFDSNGFTLYHGDCLEVLKDLKKVDMVFADPPYFLSNGGQTIQSGQVVSVDKAEWDKTDGSVHDFNYRWLELVKKSLRPGGTVWISGTMHNIFSVYQVLEELNFKVLNAITWEKRNPPPCFSCRMFTSSTEILLWARKSKSKGHTFNYELMKALNEGKQMKDVWPLPAIARWEKVHGKHPTQKPLSVVARTVLASTRRGDLVVDPFTGSSTTGIASLLFGRRFIGIDTEKEYLDVSIARYNEAISSGEKMAKKIYGLNLETINQMDI